jgi:GDPmannose 4,6-dehydratase
LTNSPQRRALIIGVSGQDGSWLTQLLLKKGYDVWGTSRNLEAQNFENLIRLKVVDQVKLLQWSVLDLESLKQIIDRVCPDEIYNLSGQSSVGMSFSNPAESHQSITLATHYLLEVVRTFHKEIRLFNASSSECFGNTFLPATENSPLNPFSPYGVAKASAFLNVANYRKVYKMFCVSGILFNHESPLRPHHFVTQKIVQTANRIAQGSNEKLELGNISIIRDWGWAPEYVDGMWRMLQQTEPNDYILASGQSHSLEYLVKETFSLLNLDWREHTMINNALTRPLEIMQSNGNSALAEKKLGWKTKVNIQELLRNMIAGHL